jgi:hypothetical protein
MNPLFPLLVETVFPVPPVCTALWTEEDWNETARTITEPLEIATGWGIARAIGRDESGAIVYSLRLALPSS